MKIAFDFDETLDRYDLQDLVAKLKHEGHDIWIVTGRHDKDKILVYSNADLYEIAEILNIPNDKIVFTNMKPKYLYFKDADFDLHVDNAHEEVNEINKFTNTHSINCTEPGWEDKVNQFIK